MNQVITNKSGQLKTHLSEYVKTYQEFDVNGRVTKTITARHDAVHGEVAVCTAYSYVGTTTRINFMLEYEVLWDSAWDLLAFPPEAINTERV